MAPTSADVSTSLDAAAEFEGTLKGKDAQILGRFKGEILVTGRLVIGEGARVDAKATADTVEIAGAFKGELTTRTLVLLDKARVDGSVEAKNISVRDGALLNGAVNIGAAHTPAARGAATG
jgi:cytoskeletal protein CcmA (bactofilin family)